MKSLEIGETVADIPVCARERWNAAEILVRPGQTYQISASAETWRDAGIESTAAGQPGKGIQKYFRPFIRCADADWFTLVATVGRSDKHPHPIGMGKDLPVTAADGEGELHFYANDVAFMYWNNCGRIHVTVTRLA